MWRANAEPESERANLKCECTNLEREGVNLSAAAAP